MVKLNLVLSKTKEAPELSMAAEGQNASHRSRDQDVTASCKTKCRRFPKTHYSENRFQTISVCVCVCGTHDKIRPPSGVTSLLSLGLLGMEIRLSGLPAPGGSVWATVLGIWISRLEGKLRETRQGSNLGMLLHYRTPG